MKENNFIQTDITDFEKKYLNLTKKLVLKHLDDDIDVFLFGSRANGTNSKFSDIDVGIWADKKIDKQILREINEEIEQSAIPYHVDIIDFFSVDNHFKEIALSKIEIWNKKS